MFCFWLQKSDLKKPSKLDLANANFNNASKKNAIKLHFRGQFLKKLTLAFKKSLSCKMDVAKNIFC